MQRALLCIGLVGVSISLSQPIQAQVTIDETLKTSVSNIGNNFTITNGTAKGSNLFHSFAQFSIPTGGSVTFDLTNNPNISTIFSRVTGGIPSSIDGTIRTINSTNPVSLFLLNPSGIMFGANANLNIGGSFIGTTANSIQFSDGTEFSATSAPPLLTISVPIGLQLGQNPAAIQVQGSGHTLIAQNYFAPYIQLGLNQGLAVSPGQTLALVGGGIGLNGGILSAPSGRVELGSVTQGEVQLVPTPQGLSLNYVKATNFGDVQLSGQSLVDANGITAGSIQVQGRNVNLADGSVLWLQNRGVQPVGSIQVDATGTLSLQGSSRDHSIVSSIRSETVAPGNGGDIQISAAQIQVLDGASIAAATFSNAPSGSVSINTTDLNVQGFLPQSPAIVSNILSTTFGQGKAGNLSVTSRQINVLAGGYLGSLTFSAGQGGNASIQADAISVSGAAPFPIPSGITASTLGDGGNSGNLVINTRILSLTNSGYVSTASIVKGSAGNLVVNASESIEIGGTYALGLNQSSISSTLAYPTLAYAQAFGLTGTPSGAAGSVTVNTPSLRLYNGGTITTSNEVSGDAGTIHVIADSIRLNQGASIVAFTSNGAGGNINIQAQNLILQHGSLISATAGGLGEGGNVSIQSPIIGGFENSDITANAINGRGGNVDITTQGLFGLKYRSQLTPDSDITASSQYGINGTVQVNSFGVNPNAGLVQLPTNTIDPNQKVVQGCKASRGNSFVITGRGGIPENPMQQVNGDRTWADLRDFSKHRPSTGTTQPPTSTPLIEATTWRRNPVTGNVELIAEHSVSSPAIATCALTP